MFNAEKPSLDELPSSARLLRSTVIAAITAIIILFTVILPAEYAIDPTGIGRLLGLVEMGEIKQELEKEAEQDRLRHGNPSQQSSLINSLLDLFIRSAHAEQAWKETITFTLAPKATAEIKLVMIENAEAEYEWYTEGGKINYDLHAHAKGKSTEYDRGRGKTTGQGTIVAAFTGQHGWFWRNRDRQDVTITLRLAGQYSEIIQPE